MVLALFDVDGTLISAAGAGSRALEATLSRIHGLSGYMEQIRLDGKTDRGIVDEVCALAGLSPGSVVLDQEFLTIFGEALSRELTPEDALRVLPGVVNLLEKLQNTPGIQLGLATGNTEIGARLKLERAGLHGYFPFGGFGSISECRTTVIRKAIDHGVRHSHPATVRRVVVIGDTPRDISHGRDAGAATVAVATGRYGFDELASHGPDMVLPSFETSNELIHFLCS